MLPGMPRNPAQMRMMMKRLGMTTEEVEDVEEVVIRTSKGDHVFDHPEVTILTVQGVKTYQVVGASELRPRESGGAASTRAGAATHAPSGPPEEDVRLVMEQAGVDREAALDALRLAEGAPAEAILHLLSRKESSRGEG
jgi:nascent polypeptide-associated complex subunit alpha